MKKIFKNLIKKFKRVDKIFAVGFAFLTLFSFVLNGAKPLLLASTLLGVSFIAWQVMRDE